MNILSQFILWLSSSLQTLQMDVEAAHCEILGSLMELIVGAMRPATVTALIATMYARNCARWQIVRRRRAKKWWRFNELIMRHKLSDETFSNINSHHNCLLKAEPTEVAANK